MRKWQLLSLLLVLVSSAAAHPLATAQQPGADVLFSRHRHFRIPFNLGQGAERLRQLQLFYSTDQGKSWQPSAVSAPDKKDFHFVCQRDGQYWFAVQTLDKQGKYYPPSMVGAKPTLRVLVDTLPPVVQLRSLPPRGDWVGVSWQVREEYMDFGDPHSINLAYRSVGSQQWSPLTINRVGTHHYWNPELRLPVEVRVQVRDRAGNLAEVTTKLNPDGTGAIVGGKQKDGGHSPVQGALPQGYAGSVNRQLINSKSISLNCEVQKVGPSGISEVELWYTMDGRNWNRYPMPESSVEDLHGDRAITDAASERRKLKKRVNFKVDEEAVYGFTVVAKSGVGRGPRPPQIGEAPQIWIEVDETNPHVSIDNVFVSQGIEKQEGKVSISWTARDKNLGKSPIRISYSKNLAGPWNPVVTDIPNTGRYVWLLPRTLPYQFYVRIEARDLAGNVGEDTTRHMVKVDLSEPQVNILKVERAGGN